MQKRYYYHTTFPALEASGGFCFAALAQQHCGPPETPEYIFHTRSMKNSTVEVKETTNV